MSYKALLDKNLSLAFSLVKDLAEVVEFTTIANRSFDFGTGSLAETGSEVIVGKLVVISKDKTPESEVIEAMLKRRDIPFLSGFDSFTLNGVTWKIDKVIKSDTYITMIQASRPLK